MATTIEGVSEPRRLSLGVPALAGLLLLAALLPLAAGYWLTRPPGPDSAEVRFARDMSAHHEQAVEMALIIRDRSADEVLRTFAGDIVYTQQSQIGRMAGWLEVWGQPYAGAAAPMDGMGQMMGMAAQAEVNALRDLPLAEAEVRFLQLMTSHHEGGVHMAEEVLAARPRPEVARLAQAVVRGQQSEIGLMAELLAERGAEPPPPLQPMDHDH
jgi:uncharacterized protein (DUF305 family)